MSDRQRVVCLWSVGGTYRRRCVAHRLVDGEGLGPVVVEPGGIPGAVGPVWIPVPEQFVTGAVLPLAVDLSR
jgi:hypothetical protein